MTPESANRRANSRVMTIEKSLLCAYSRCVPSLRRAALSANASHCTFGAKSAAELETITTREPRLGRIIGSKSLMKYQ